jgi:hypothetical protein
MKIVQNGFILASKNDYEGKFEFVFREYDASQYGSDKILLGKHTIEFEVPDDFDPREGLVRNLQRKKKKLADEFNARVTEIDRQIQTYLAIEA